MYKEFLYITYKQYDMNQVPARKVIHVVKKLVSFG